VREHFAFVWRVLRRLGLAPADADDAAQKVMLVLARRLEDVREGSERAFLSRTAVFIAAKEKRAHRRARWGADVEETDLVDPRAAPDACLEQARARRTLDRILERLPDEQRVVFVLFEIEGLSQSEVAEVVGAPQGTVASRLRRARETVLSMARAETGVTDAAERAERKTP
jgi:RNA polymerase sigma-70 factor (ECF subfamily)